MGVKANDNFTLNIKYWSVIYAFQMGFGAPFVNVQAMNHGIYIASALNDVLIR